MNHSIRASTKEFRQHWGSYVLLLLTMNLALEWLVIPLLRWLTEQVLKLGNIPYLTITNLPEVLGHPLVELGLLAVVLLLLLALYWQFSFLLSGIALIKQEGSLKPLTLIRFCLSQMRQLPLRTFGYFLIYGFLILPFANFFFQSVLLSKIKIPDFVVDFLSANPLYFVLIMLFFLLMLYVGLRSLYFLPNLILQKLPAKTAFQESWQRTKGHSLKLFFRLFWLNFLTVLFTLVIVFGLYLLQLGLDQLPSYWPLVGATLNLGVMEVATQLITLWAMVVFFQLIMPDLSLPAMPAAKARRLPTRILAISVIAVLGIAVMIYNALFLTGALTSFPLTISHRGVNGANGVQNTIPAMAETIKAKPDYIEMDIHETKDQQFVVMHDENLEALAGVNKAPHQLTLAELTKLTVHENGHEAKIASFDDYLAYANQHHQKLLIEIKTTKMDSPKMLQHFIERYQATILAHQHRIHSLDYQVVTGLKEQAPELFVSFILPYNFVYPQTPANAYTMEQTTLDSDFIDKAHQAQKEVYIWTVNDSTTMDNLFFMDVDGIITDDLSTLKDEIKTYQNSPSYADRLLLYVTQLTSLRNQEN